MRHVEVESVEQETSRQGIPLWRIAVLTTEDDGTTSRLLHVMPKWSVESRMAEYNVDQETAIRVLLTEPFMPVPLIAPIHVEPIWRNAAAAHVEAVEQLELGFDALAARVDGDASHPFEVILDEPANSDLVASLRREVADVRQMLRTEPAPVEPPRAAQAPSSAPK